VKKVLFLEQYGSMGGGQQVLKEVVSIFRSRHWHITLAAPGGGEVQRLIQADSFIDLPEPRLSHGKKTFLDGINLLLVYFQTVKLLKHLQHQNVIYVNGPRFAPLIWMLQPFLKKQKIVYHLHLEHSLSQRRFFITTLKSKNTTAVIANSEYTLNSLLQIDPSLRENPKLRRIDNALGAAYGSLPFRAPTNRPLKITVIGRISHEKGQDRVFALADQFPENEFHFIGDTDFTDPGYLKKLQEKSPPNVTWAAEVENIKGYLLNHGISISIAPSRATESFGLVAIESMACSCYTVVSDAGNLKNMAAELGCPCFKNDAELEAELKKALDIPPAVFESTVRKQHQAVNAKYAPERFAQELGRFISELEKTL